MWWDCAFTPLLNLEGVSQCPFRIDLSDASAPLLKTHRLVLSEGGNRDLTSFYSERTRERGPWHKYFRLWPTDLRAEPGQKEKYHPTNRAIAEIAREHWLWHLWQRGLAPIDRSCVSLSVDYAISVPNIWFLRTCRTIIGYTRHPSSNSPMSQPATGPFIGSNYVGLLSSCIGVYEIHVPSGKEATLVPKRCVPDATGPVFLADMLPPTFFTVPNPGS